MEILDTTTLRVRQTMANVTSEEYAVLRVEEPYRKKGVGGLAAYSSYFRCPAGADVAGPMQAFDHGGHRWRFCAQPEGEPTFPAGPGGSRLMSVNKHHSIVYAAGCELRYLESPEGDTYVHVVGARQGAEDLRIPDRRAFRALRLEKETTVDLPGPTQALFFTSAAGLESYQGPVERPGH